MKKDDIRGLCLALADEIETVMEKSRPERIAACTDGGKTKLNEAAFAMLEAKIFAQELLISALEDLCHSEK